MGFFYVPMFNIYMKLLSEVFWRFELKIISELMTTSQSLLFVISGNTESEHGRTNRLMMANKLSFNQDKIEVLLVDDSSTNVGSVQLSFVFGNGYSFL